MSWWGEQYLPNSEVKYGITVDTLGQKLGLRNGDKILTLDNKPIDDFFRIPATIVLEDVQTIQVERDSQTDEDCDSTGIDFPDCKA